MSPHPRSPLPPDPMIPILPLCRHAESAEVLGNIKALL